MNKAALNRKTLTYLLFIIGSVLLLALGFYHLYNQNKYIKEGIKVTAIVENVLTHPESGIDNYEQELVHYESLLNYYRNEGVISETTNVAIIITYDYNGKTYLTELGYYSPEIKIAQTVRIYINKNNPLDFMYDGENKFGLYFCMIVGGVMLVFFTALFFVNKHNIKCNNVLREKGKKIEAEIIYADIEENKTLFNKHPYKFTCIYIKPETNEEIIFTTDSVYCKNFGNNYIGQKVIVYVDENNYSNYYVDVKIFEK